MTRPYVVIALLGQSNMAGFASLGTQDVDVSGIFQFGGQVLDTATYEQITSDITPLFHPRTSDGYQDTTKQLGPGDYIARQLYSNGYVPSTHDLLIVPCARGGTTLTGGEEEWKPTAPLGELMQNAIDRSTNAINAALAIDSQSYFAGFAWGQGENDAGGTPSATEADYLAAFNLVVAQMRGNIPTAQDCWAMITGMMPEFTQNRTGAPAIEAAHRRAALENANVFFQEGLAGFDSGDKAHYNAAGYRALGIAAADELVARLADPAVSYGFDSQEIDDTSIIGATQRGGTNFTIRDGTGSGAAAKSLTATGTGALASLGTTGLRFDAIDSLEDMQVEWSSNTDGQQAVILRASGAHGSTLGSDGYLIGMDTTGTGSVGLFITSGGNTSAAVAGATDLGLTGSTARFRASALGTAITFEVSNDDGANWTQAFTHTDSTFSSGDLVYMQGGNGTTGNEIFAYDFEVRNIAPAVTLGALTLPASVEQGQLVAITGATAGSTITATTLPTGWTLDSAARTIAIASDATLGSQSWAFSEALTGATNTPNPSTGSSTVGVSTGFSFTNIEASNYVAAMTVAPNNTRKGAIDQLVTALKTASLFAKMDALWLADAHDDQAARLNLISPASNVITGAATFAAGTGYTGNTTNVLDTNFALDGGTNYSDTSASIFVHSPNFNSSTGQIFGYASGTDITFSPATDAGGWFGRMGDGVGGTPSFSAGLSVLTYDNGTTRAYNNGTLGDTDTRDRRDVTPSENLTLMGANGISSGYTISSAGVGAGLSASEIADLDTALAAYRTAIGGGTLPVISAGASGALSLVGTASASLALSALANGGFDLAGDAASTVNISALASGTLSLDGFGSLSVGAQGATATGLIGFLGTASGASSILGQAASSFALTGAASASVDIVAEAGGVIALSGVALIGTTPTGAVASGQISLSGASQARVDISAFAAGDLLLSGSGQARGSVNAVCSGAFAISGAANAEIRIGAQGSGVLTLVGSALLQSGQVNLIPSVIFLVEPETTAFTVISETLQ